MNIFVRSAREKIFAVQLSGPGWEQLILPLGRAGWAMIHSNLEAVCGNARQHDPDVRNISTSAIQGGRSRCFAGLP
jgi:hypothetical protein